MTPEQEAANKAVQEAKRKEAYSLSPIFSYFGEHPRVIHLLGFKLRDYKKTNDYPMVVGDDPNPATLESAPGRRPVFTIFKMYSDRDDGLVGEYKSVADAEDDFFNKIPELAHKWTSIFNVNQCLTRVAMTSRRGCANTILCNAKTVKKEFGKFKVIEAIGRWKKIDITFREWGHLKNRVNFFISDDMPDNQLIAMYAGSSGVDAAGGLVKTKGGVLLYATSVDEADSWIKYTNYAIKLIKEETEKETKWQTLLRLKNYLNAALTKMFKK